MEYNIVKLTNFIIVTVTLTANTIPVLERKGADLAKL